jgi:HAD superfamily hydrolase (TIGR01509 family)
MSPIKLIVFDFDGTLVSLRDVHYGALNAALAEIDPKFIITPDEHSTTFDGLSTKRKFTLLTEQKGFPTDAETHARVFERKQMLTIEAIKNGLKHDQRIVDLLTSLREKGYLIYLASNAIQFTVQAGLQAIGAWHLFDKVFTNEDVYRKRQKPDPDIYLQCMVEAGIDPGETLIVEDSKHGREAAYRSGAFVCGVDNPNDLTLKKVERAIELAKSKPKRWSGGSTNIVCAMSGLGSRFSAAGYKMPKPLIDVCGKPMIQRVVENIPIDGKWIFVVQRAHYDGYYLGTLLNSIAPGCEVICVDGQTQGAACSVLLAKSFINNDDHLIVANSDQIIEYDICSFMWNMISSPSDGGILTFTDTNPKWSFAKIGKDGWVEQVAEKKPISDQATCGIYYWAHGSMYVKYAEQMIKNNIRHNNEFYVAPVYQEAITDGKKIKTFPAQKMIGLGTPEDLTKALENEIKWL